MSDDTQELRKHYPVEPEEKHPADPRSIRVFQNIRRVISFLYGVAGSTAVRIKATAAGALHVSIQDSVLTAAAPLNVDTEFSLLTHHETESGAGNDAYVEATFTAEQKCVDVFVWDNPIMVKTKTTAGAYGDEFEIPANSVYPIPLAVKQLSVKNKTPASNGRWQAVGFYVT